MLKSEISDNVVEEAIFLSPKVYSIMTHPIDGKNSDSKLTKTLIDSDAKIKMAVKGCPNKIVEKHFQFNQFKKILFGEKCPSVESHHIAYNRTFRTMVTEKRSKIPLALYDNKRFWTDVNTSYGYNHPKSIEGGYKTGDILTTKGGFIMKTREIIENRKDECNLDNMSGEEYDEYWYYEDLRDKNNLDILVNLINVDKENEDRMQIKLGIDDSLLNEENDDFDDMEFTENGYVLYDIDTTDVSPNGTGEDNDLLEMDIACSSYTSNQIRKRKRNGVSMSLNHNKIKIFKI